MTMVRLSAQWGRVSIFGKFGPPPTMDQELGDIGWSNWTRSSVSKGSTSSWPSSMVEVMTVGGLAQVVGARRAAERRTVRRNRRRKVVLRVGFRLLDGAGAAKLRAWQIACRFCKASLTVASERTGKTPRPPGGR